MATIEMEDAYIGGFDQKESKEEGSGRKEIEDLAHHEEAGYEFKGSLVEPVQGDAEVGGDVAHEARNGKGQAAFKLVVIP